MMPQEYAYVAETFETLAIRSEQLHALSRVIEDASAIQDKDFRSIQIALELLSLLLADHHASIDELQKHFFKNQMP